MGSFPSHIRIGPARPGRRGGGSRGERASDLVRVARRSSESLGRVSDPGRSSVSGSLIRVARPGRSGRGARERCDRIGSEPGPGSVIGPLLDGFAASNCGPGRATRTSDAFAAAALLRPSASAPREARGPSPARLGRARSGSPSIALSVRLGSHVLRRSSRAPGGARPEPAPRLGRVRRPAESAGGSAVRPAAGMLGRPGPNLPRHRNRALSSAARYGAVSSSQSGAAAAAARAPPPPPERAVRGAACLDRRRLEGKHGHRLVIRIPSPCPSRRAVPVQDSDGVPVARLGSG
jgi:hypothetical protein